MHKRPSATSAVSLIFLMRGPDTFDGVGCQSSTAHCIEANEQELSPFLMMLSCPQPRLTPHKTPCRIHIGSHGIDAPGQDDAPPGPGGGGPRASSCGEGGRRREHREQQRSLLGQGRDCERHLYQPRGTHNVCVWVKGNKMEGGWAPLAYTRL